MNELDTRLDQAAHDLRTAVERLDLRELSPRRRRSVAAGPGTVAVMVFAAIAGVMVFVASRDATTGNTGGRPIAVRADDQLAADVIEIAARHGWHLTVGDGRDARRAYATASGGGYVEVRARSTDPSDTLLVSISVNDPQAVAAGSDDRGGLLRTVGSARVYVGTNSPIARAVELFDDATIVYVRSESGTETARNLEELADVAIAIDEVWATRDVTYPSSASDDEPDDVASTADQDTAEVLRTGRSAVTAI